MTFKHFFGRTWVGSAKKLTKENLVYNESVIFCTAIKDEHILLVIELVSRLKNSTLKSLGWSAFRPFSSSNLENNSAQRVGFYLGTPRALLFIDEPFESWSFFTLFSDVYKEKLFKTRAFFLK